MLTQQRLHELFDYRDDGTLVRRNTFHGNFVNHGGVL